jgi:TELO2-interacting protein 2
MLSEMLGHLERQPLNRERRLAWLTLIGPVFEVMGLFLLAHFRRLFSLFFQWMRVDDDKTIILVRNTYTFISLKRLD